MPEISFENCSRERLNLGSGKTYKKEFWNVDINPKFNPDLVCDMMELECQKDLFIEVLMHDVLDHVTFHEAHVLLRRVLGWLKKDGILSVHTPNLDFLVEVLYKSTDKELRHEAIKWLYSTDGMGTTDYKSNSIRWCYNKKSLTELLEGVGFKILHSDINCDGFGLTVIAQKC